MIMMTRRVETIAEQGHVGLTEKRPYFNSLLNMLSTAADGLTLDCCEGVVKEVTCELNEKCNALGLQGGCCPTSNGFGYLDCCSPLPEECLAGGAASCNVTSATSYLEFGQSTAESPASSGSAATTGSTTAMASTLLLLVVMMVSSSSLLWL